jgi:hypothetical protein
MQGNYLTPLGVDLYYSAMFIEQLQMKPAIVNLRPNNIYITTEEWKSGWQKIKEHTATGSDFWHSGHFKAGCTNDIITNFKATMANIPLLSRYSPPRWQKAVDCMLLKREGNYQVDKLCTIVLFDLEANHIFKYIGWKVMAHTKTHHQLATEQYGSHKKKTGILHALNKRLSYDLLHQFKHPGALCSDDAKLCYDQILHAVTSL